jgi:hypothetical protein
LVDIIAQAKDFKKKCEDHWSSIYQAGIDDLHFLSDDPSAQWDEKDYNARKRKNRPILTIDQTTQFVNQVSNDIRMNTPTINVIPHSGGADVLTAEIYQGLIRDIEQSSNADAAYDHSVNCAIRSSIGFIRVNHRIKDVQTGQQELYIERVTNQFSVYLDPESTEPDGSDAQYAIAYDTISKDSFEKKYKGFNPVSFDDGRDEEYICVAEYFYIEEEEGQKTVRRYLLSGEDILEETTFPGQYIPIIPVYGEESWVNGERKLHSLIRKAKDPQRRYNYLASMEAEMLMKAPKAAIIAVGGTTENYADDYKNPDDAIVLRYDQMDSKGNPAPAPQLNYGPQIPSGIVNSMQMAAQDIKATMGLYNAFLGQGSNETSGVAIQQRKMEGDRAVYHFGDNLVRSIGQVGRVLVSAIPYIYVQPRIERVVSGEEETELIGLNGALADGQTESIYLDNGQYSVRVTTGASFATMREEAANFFQQVIQSQPQLIEIAGDLLFKYMDFPGAQALSERMKRLIPPNILEDEENPQVAALAQENEQLKALMAQLQQELQSKQAEQQLKLTETQMRLQTEQIKADLEQQKIQLQKVDGMRDGVIRQQEMEIKQKEIELKQAEIDLKEQQINADIIKTRIEAKANMSQDLVMYDTDLNEGTPPMVIMMNEFGQSINNLAQAQLQSSMAIMEAVSQPKPDVKIIRNKQGFIDRIVQDQVN